MSQLTYLLRLVRFAFHSNPLLYPAIAVTLASAAIELAAMASLMPLLSLVSGGTATGPIPRALGSLDIAVTPKSLLWAFLVLFIARIASQVAGQTLFTFLGRRVMAQLGSTGFAHVTQSLSLAEINRKSIGYFMGLAGEEAFRASVVVIALAQFLGTAVLSVLYFCAIAWFSPSAAWMLVAFLSVAGVFVFMTARASARLGARQATQSRGANSVFLDAMNNLKAVRAFRAEGYVSDLYRRLIFQYSRTWFCIDEVAVLSRMVPVLTLLGMASAWLASSAGSVEALGLPFIVTLIAFLIRFFPTLGQGVSLAMRIAAESRSGKDMSEIIHQPVSAAKDAPGLLGPIREIQLEHLDFRFESGRRVLSDFNARFTSGRSYAIAGRSGTGKSTLADMLVGFQAPQRGNIRFNGVPLPQIAPTELRDRVLLVSQEAAIFNDSLANNLLLGQEADVQRLRTVVREAELEDVLIHLPAGLDTVIQYHGRNLSGGQRQRISLARALLRNPDVLVLDECTSALDKLTQQRLVETVLARFAGRIVIFITHDPDVLSRVDEVVTLPDLAGVDAGAEPS